MLAGLIHWTDITQSRVDLGDIATMNDLLDIRAVNDRRINESRQGPDPGDQAIPPPGVNPPFPFPR